MPFTIKRLLFICVFMLIANVCAIAELHNKGNSRSSAYKSSMLNNRKSKSIATFKKKYATEILIFILTIVFILILLPWNQEGKKGDISTIFKWRREYQLNTSKAAYIREVLKWCVENMNTKKGNNFPHLEISYYKHKKNAGLYDSYIKMIRINVNNHNNVLELTDTIIHEYQHHLDMPTQKQQKEYNELTVKNGYWNNPYEIKARESGLKLRDACAKELFKKGFHVIK